jgi:hypothetical protein
MISVRSRGKFGRNKLLHVRKRNQTSNSSDPFINLSLYLEVLKAVSHHQDTTTVATLTIEIEVIGGKGQVGAGQMSAGTTKETGGEG